METAFWREDGSSNLQFGMVRGDLPLGETRTVKTKELGLVRATGFPPSYVTTKQPNTFGPFFSHLILQTKPLIHYSPSYVSNSTNAKQRKNNNLGSVAILIKPCDQNPAAKSKVPAFSSTLKFEAQVFHGLLDVNHALRSDTFSLLVWHIFDQNNDEKAI